MQFSIEDYSKQNGWRKRQRIKLMLLDSEMISLEGRTDIFNACFYGKIILFDDDIYFLLYLNRQSQKQIVTHTISSLQCGS
jgi:hypothetical protein